MADVAIVIVLQRAALEELRAGSAVLLPLGAGVSSHPLRSLCLHPLPLPPAASSSSIARHPLPLTHQHQTSVLNTFPLLLFPHTLFFLPFSETAASKDNTKVLMHRRAGGFFFCVFLFHFSSFLPEIQAPQTLLYDYF